MLQSVVRSLKTKLSAHTFQSQIWAGIMDGEYHGKSQGLVYWSYRVWFSSWICTLELKSNITVWELRK
jgi:hypothetical protein